MPTNYSGGGGWPTMPLKLVNDGEIYNFASIQKDAAAGVGLFGKLIDAVVWLKASAVDALSTQTLLTPTTETRYVNMTPLYDSSKWTFGGTGDLTVTGATGAGDLAYWPIPVPHGQTLTSFTVDVIPAGGHGGLPATMPVATLYKRTISTNTETSIATKTDASGSVVAYEAQHSITPTAFSEVIDRSINKYYLKFVSEYGANSLTGLVVVGISITYTRSTIGSD